MEPSQASWVLPLAHIPRLVGCTVSDETAGLHTVHLTRSHLLCWEGRRGGCAYSGYTDFVWPGGMFFVVIVRSLVQPRDPSFLDTSNKCYFSYLMQTLCGVSQVREMRRSLAWFLVFSPVRCRKQPEISSPSSQDEKLGFALPLGLR